MTKIKRFNLTAVFFFLRRFLPRWVIATLVTIISVVLVVGMVWLVFALNLADFVMFVLFSSFFLIVFAVIVANVNKILPEEWRHG